MNSEEYAEVYRKQRTMQEGNQDPPIQRWCRPELNWIKCNYDASFINSDTTAQAGRVYRDGDGTFKGAAQAKGPPVQNALESECQGLIQAMQHSWTRGYKKVIFEGDCQELIKLLHGKSLNFEAHNWIREIRTWASKFEDVQHRWISRQYNKVADCLLKASILNDLSFVSFYYAPTNITEFLHSDHVTSSFV